MKLGRSKSTQIVLMMRFGTKRGAGWEVWGWCGNGLFLQHSYICSPIRMAPNTFFLRPRHLVGYVLLRSYVGTCGPNPSNSLPEMWWNPRICIWDMLIAWLNRDSFVTHDARPLESKWGGFVFKHAVPTNIQVCLDWMEMFKFAFWPDMLLLLSFLIDCLHWIGILFCWLKFSWKDSGVSCFWMFLGNPMKYSMGQWLN